MDSQTPAPFQVITFDAKPDELPLYERIGLRGRIATFESQFKEGFIGAVEADVKSLAELPLGGICAYGATDCDINPFIYKPETPYRSLPLCSAIISNLRVKNFKSKYLSDLARDTIEIDDSSRGTQSDEIHTDPEEQFIFSNMGEDPQSMEAHKLLRGHVLKNHLYYVLLHTVPYEFEGYWLSDWVVLFALGVSPHTGNLIGVVTHQICHNLCD